MATQAQPGGRTLAQWYCLLGGASLLLAGIVGFIADATFGTGDSLERGKLILFDVNGWHNVVHLATGLIGLAVAGSALASRTYCLAYGTVYVLVTLLGLVALDGTDVLLEIIPINGADNVLHALLAITAIGAGLATAAKPAPTTRAA